MLLAGTVFKEEAAIKMIKGRQRNNEAAILREIAIMERAKTDYVVRFLGYSVCPDGILFGMELMPGGTLQQALQRNSEYQWWNR